MREVEKHNKAQRGQKVVQAEGEQAEGEQAEAEPAV